MFNKIMAWFKADKGKKFYKRRWFITLSIWVILAIIGGIFGEDPKDDQAKIQDQQEYQNQRENEKKEQQQQAFIKFVDDLYRQQAHAAPAEKQYEKIAKKHENGDASIQELYAATKNAKEKTDQSWYAIGKIEISKVFDKNIATTVKSIQENFQLSYLSRVTAYKKLMKYLDDQKPGDLQAAQDQIRLAQDYFNKSSNEIVKVKSELGIKEY